jgi:hypothetical protein
LLFLRENFFGSPQILYGSPQKDQMKANHCPEPLEISTVIDTCPEVA